MLDIAQQHPGITIAEVAERFRMTPVGVLKHIKLLERAKLLSSRREGRIRRLYFNAVPIQHIYDRWTDSYSSFWAGRMLDMKERLEVAGGQRVAEQPSRTGGGDGEQKLEARSSEPGGTLPGDATVCLPSSQPQQHRRIRSA